MIISIHQPAYLPWLGYFDKIKKSDLFIILDTVQFQKNSYQNRNVIFSKNLEKIWLTVPVKKDSSKTIKDIRIHNLVNWQKKHNESIKFNYSKSKNFNKIDKNLNNFYNTEWIYLNDLCYQMLIYFCDLMHIKTKIIKLSDESDVFGNKSDLILNICKKYNATTYYSGINGKNYLDLNKFNKYDIKISFQNFIKMSDNECQEYLNLKKTSIIEHIMNNDDLSVF
jgi:hypothetical protein